MSKRVSDAVDRAIDFRNAEDVGDQLARAIVPGQVDRAGLCGRATADDVLVGAADVCRYDLEDGVRRNYITSRRISATTQGKELCRVALSPPAGRGSRTARHSQQV
jgi:hypothetical protein